MLVMFQGFPLALFWYLFLNTWHQPAWRVHEIFNRICFFSSFVDGYKCTHRCHSDCTTIIDRKKLFNHICRNAELHHHCITVTWAQSRLLISIYNIPYLNIKISLKLTQINKSSKLNIPLPRFTTATAAAWKSISIIKMTKKRNLN